MLSAANLLGTLRVNFFFLPPPTPPPTNPKTCCFYEAMLNGNHNIKQVHISPTIFAVIQKPEKYIERLMHPEFKIQEIFPKRFANAINKPVHSKCLFIRFVNLEGNISCILNPVCINLYITYHKNDVFLHILFQALSNKVNKFCKVTSSTLTVPCDSIQKEIFPTGNYKFYFPQKLLKKNSFRYAIY